MGCFEEYLDISVFLAIQVNKLTIQQFLEKGHVLIKNKTIQHFLGQQFVHTSEDSHAFTIPFIFN